jgi:putative ubiquitin-RnfH superfamily antitoxin RatB of RatAB toxin-antitoxin module
MAEATLSIEVVWVGVEPPVRLALRVPAGSTVEQALAASGIARSVAAAGCVPGAQGPLDALSVAVHGRAVGPQDRLHEHDRIELLPPLTVDPKVARQRRADHRRRLAGERRWTPDCERTVPRRP